MTQGALDNLNRDELQGVIAHEFSHVLNGDMRLNVQLMGWLFGLFVIALIGRTMLRIRAARPARRCRWLMVAASSIMVLGYIGLFFGRIAAGGGEPAARAARGCVQRAVHSQSGRVERRAAEDRGSHRGLAGSCDADAEQAAHMLFAPGSKRFFQTHPPLAERIKALDPRFDVKRLPALAANALKVVPAFDTGELAEASVSNLASASGSDVAAWTRRPRAESVAPAIIEAR